MDNDEAGHTARKNFRSELKTVGFSGKVIDKIPIMKWIGGKESDGPMFSTN